MLQKIISIGALCLALNTSVNAQQFARSTQILFNGNFKTVGTLSPFYLAIQNDKNVITGFFVVSEDEIYPIEGRVSATGQAWVKIKDGDFSYDCKLYYKNHKLFVALDPDLIATMRVILMIAGQWDALLAVQDETEMTFF